MVPIILLAGLFATSATFAAVQKDSITMPVTYAKIEAFLFRHPEITAISDLLPYFPEQYRKQRNITFFHSSESNQESTPIHPRTVSFGKTSEFALSVNGHPSLDGFKRLELAKFENEEVGYVFRQIIEENGKLRLSGENPDSCMRCHGTSLGTKPIADDYFIWPTSLGSFDDGLIDETDKKNHELYKDMVANSDSERFKKGAPLSTFQEFKKFREANLKNPRYSVFFPDEFTGDSRDPKNYYPYHRTELREPGQDQRVINNPERGLWSMPNARLTGGLSVHYAAFLMNKFKKGQFFRKYALAFFYFHSDCNLSPDGKHKQMEIWDKVSVELAKDEKLLGVKPANSDLPPRLYNLLGMKEEVMHLFSKEAVSEAKKRSPSGQLSYDTGEHDLHTLVRSLFIYEFFPEKRPVLEKKTDEAVQTYLAGNYKKDYPEAYFLYGKNIDAETLRPAAFVTVSLGAGSDPEGTLGLECKRLKDLAFQNLKLDAFKDPIRESFEHKAPEKK